jgi:hypothetical protein
VPQREKPLNLLFAILRAASQVGVHPVLDRLRIGDRREAHADRRVLVSPDDDLTLTPGNNVPAGACVQNRPTQPFVSVNHDVVERTGMVSVCAGTPDCIPRTGLLLPRSAHVTAGGCKQ